jgi:hypothetical protein
MERFSPFFAAAIVHCETLHLAASCLADSDSSALKINSFLYSFWLAIIFISLAPCSEFRVQTQFIPSKCFRQEESLLIIGILNKVCGIPSEYG